MTSEEMERILQSAVDATRELRQATSEAHSARKDLIAEAKKRRDEITALIVREVTDQVGELTAAAEQEMRAEVTKVIARIEADWREKLGLAIVRPA